MGVGAAVALTIAVAAVLATQSVARPLDAPSVDDDPLAHHHDDLQLWSRDRDRVNRSTLANGSGSASYALAERTDIPFNRPPEAVEAWNREQLAKFPTTDAETSIYPTSARPTNGNLIGDAYVEIFTVQPSTRVRLTPDRQPRYVATEGQVFATLDYRVPVPSDLDGPWQTITWSRTNHSIDDSKLLVDGDREAKGGDSHVQRLSYNLSDEWGRTNTLQVKANISAALTRTHRWCSNRTVVNRSEDGDFTMICANWKSNTTTLNETLTVTDSLDAKPHSLLAAGAYARYPDGDLGLLIFKTGPWLGYRLPEGRVSGVWRFYSARDPGWDRLVTATSKGQNVSHSPLHPLEVSAYPIKTGPTVAPAESVTLLNVSGRQRQPPTLPSTVHLDVSEQPYTASYKLATRFESPNATVDDVAISGLVRGTEWELNPAYFTEITIHRSNLTLSVLNTSDRTATVRVTLHDVTTGTPIRTKDTEGYVRLAGERVDTGHDGTVTTTIARPVGTVTARFEPWDWWLRPTSYVGDSDSVSVQGTALTVVYYLHRAGIPVGLFLLAVFLVDRITGLSVWPPWRGL